jgi:CRISPR-associated protein Cmr6
MGRSDVPRPLYKNLAYDSLQLGTGNAGLWYDKLCDRWSDDWTLSGGDDGKLAWIESVTKQPVGLEKLLMESTTRALRLTLAKGGIFGIFETESRFVTGLGRSHPIENGFAWHPTLGVPYLPGTSVKGLVRAWAERDAEPRPSADLVEGFLGSAGAAGQVVFLDAIAIAPVQHEADVMTPHFAGWSPNKPPGDWCSPVPVPFLVVAPQTAFAFSILPICAGAVGTLEEIFEWLCAALESAGAGAKTSVGYGRFRFDQPKTKQQKAKLDKERDAQAETARQAELQRTPEGRWMLLLEGKTEEHILEMVRIHLEKQLIPDSDERTSFAKAVSATGLPALWRKGQKQDSMTKVGSTKLKERAKLVERHRAVNP